MVMQGWQQQKLIAMASKWLKDRCTVEAEVQVTGVYGEPSQVWQVTGADVPCRMITAGGARGNAIEEAGAQETMKHEYRIVLAVTTVVGVDCRITFGGHIYHVIRVESGLTDESFKQAIVIRRDG